MGCFWNHEHELALDVKSGLDPIDCKFKAKDYFPLFKPALCLISPDIDILAKHHFSGTDIPKHVIKPIYIQEGEGYKSGLD